MSKGLVCALRVGRQKLGDRHDRFAIVKPADWMSVRSACGPACWTWACRSTPWCRTGDPLRHSMPPRIPRAKTHDGIDASRLPATGDLDLILTNRSCPFMSCFSLMGHVDRVGAPSTCASRGRYKLSLRKFALHVGRIYGRLAFQRCAIRQALKRRSLSKIGMAFAPGNAWGHHMTLE